MREKLKRVLDQTRPRAFDVRKCRNLIMAFGVGSGLAFAGSIFTPGNLVVSRSVYSGSTNTVKPGQPLPPSCPAGNSGCATAQYDGNYPTVFNNDLVDGSFGVTAPIFLDQITPTGQLVSTYSVPTKTLVTSFSSKSELALNVSQDGQSLTFMGYIAPANAVDVSNSNTPLGFDPTNPVGASYYRAVAQLTPNGALQVFETNAYSGNNGRAAVSADGYFYAVGNSNNGSGTPSDVVAGAGAQLITPVAGSGSLPPTEIGDFSVTQYGYKQDKLGKDNNFRGLRIYGQTLYVTKGSGGNGIDTVYQVGSQGTLPDASDAAGTPISILNGFPTVLAKKAGVDNIYPFGIWFANPTTLYVADEGDGNYSDASGSKFAGLQKWTLQGSDVWTLQYVLQAGLKLGAPYAVPANPEFPGQAYPTGINTATGLNWAPETAGLRNLTGRVNGDGTVTIWAVTSTVSGSGDQGADPNELVSVTDSLAAVGPAAPADEAFTVIDQAKDREVLRGVSFAPVAAAPVSVATNGLSYSRATNLWTASVTVANNTTQAISGPLMVALTGLTQDASVPGNPEIVFDSPAVPFLSGGSLAPGQALTVPLTFSDPSMGYISFQPVVFPRF